VDPTIETLRNHPLCEGLKEEELARLARHATPISLPAGANIYRSGQPIEAVYMLVSGRARLTVLVPDKAATLELESAPDEEFLGAVALLESGAALGDMVAIEPVRLLSIPREPFLELLQSIPSLGLHLIRRLARRTMQIAGVERPQPRALTVGVIWTGPRGRSMLDLLGRELAARGERVARADLGAGSQGERWEHLLSSHDRAFLELDLDRLSGGWMGRAAACDELLWLVDAENERLLRQTLSLLVGEAPQAAARSHVVWMLPEGAQVAPPWDRAWDLNERPHLLLELGEAPERLSRLGRMGLERLLRRLRGIQLGLSLGGGGARGLAHLGVFRAFERAGISFDLMSGTSCGAMVGITYAAGYSPDVLIAAYKSDLTPPWLFRQLPRGRNWYLVWQFRTGAWDALLRQYLRDWPLERLPIPFRAVTVDLISGREVVHRAGDAVRAILESINLPVISKPIVHDGMALVDGSVLNNLPADVLTEEGAQLVVGVDVSSRLRDELAGNRPDTPTAQMRSVGSVDTIIRVAETQGRGLGALRADSMDLTIRPDASAFSFVDFSKAPELADVGEAAAERAIPRLKEMLAGLERRAAAGRRP
jgi:predicted acylesterase/phospholipase RssA